MPSFYDITRLLLAVATLLTASATMAEPAFRSDPANRKIDRPPELWRYYMHGTADFFAKPLNPSFPDAVIEKDLLKTPYFQEGIKAIRLEPGEHKTSAPLELDLSSFRGRKLRLFYWMRGENIDKRPTVNSYSDAPQLLTVVRDGKGRQISKLTSHNGAVGVHPWHGYYLDLQIPPAGKKLQLVLDNSNTRRAWFGRFAFEPIDKSNTFSQNEKQDPDTGSLAAFPWYEPINFHFFAKPMGTRYRWNFMRGPAAGMIGQPYDLTTINGLQRYFQESVKVDLDQMNHGIMYFPMRYRQGKEAGVLPPLPENWIAEIGRLVTAEQDPVTGYWGTQAIPKSMSVTFHFLDMLFAFGVERYDEPAIPDPGRCLTATMPNPEAMVRTTLKLQSTYEKDGRRELAAWSQSAYNFTDNPDQAKSRCALGTTMNAIRLLRLCRRFVSPELQQESDRAVEAAFKYVMTRSVTPEGLWKQQETDAGPSKPAYFMNIVNFSRYLEKRTDSTIPLPALTLTSGTDGNTLTLQCSAWANRQNSIRVYAVSQTPIKPELLKPAMIVGIVSRGETKPIEMDPLLAVRRCSLAAQRNWGDDSDLTSKSYIGHKALVELRKDIPCATGNRPLNIKRSELPPKTQRLLATAVDWYGAESVPVELPLPPGDQAKK